ncbi:MAG TPA: lysophospholipase [Stellaceae bacterium]|nr:lysophospholipase [Stellaceae bacterium]
MSARTGLAAILALGLVAGCAGPESAGPPGPPGSVAPAITETSFVADDGTELPLKSWLPDGKPKAVILALHGFNDYSNAFKESGEEWAKHGIATFAYDQRGFGAAPRHGYWADASRLAADATEATAVLRARYQGVPIYILGESMGGAVAVVAETGFEGTPPPRVDGLILEGPAVWGRDTMTISERIALWLGDRVLPGMKVTGRGLGIMPSDNIEMLRALGRDALVIKETRIDSIKGLVDIMDDALAAAPRLHAPMLFLYGDHDEVIPRDSTRRFLAALPADEPRRIAFYPAGYHMLLRDLEADVVRRDVEAWVANPEVALPSGADRHAEEALAAGR